MSTPDDPGTTAAGPSDEPAPEQDAVAQVPGAPLTGEQVTGEVPAGAPADDVRPPVAPDEVPPVDVAAEQAWAGDPVAPEPAQPAAPEAEPEPEAVTDAWPATASGAADAAAEAPVPAEEGTALVEQPLPDAGTPDADATATPAVAEPGRAVAQPALEEPPAAEEPTAAAGPTAEEPAAEEPAAQDAAAPTAPVSLTKDEPAPEVHEQVPVGTVPAVTTDQEQAAAPAPAAPASDAPASAETTTPAVAEEPASAAVVPGEPSGPPRALVAAVALLAVLAVLLGLLAWTSRGEGAGADDRSAALDAARSGARAVFSYDYRHLAKDFAAGKAVTTGAFRSEYERTTGKLVQDVAPRYKAVVVAEVGAASVVSASHDRVLVLAFVDQQSSSSLTSSPKITQSRLEMTMVRRGGQWLIEKIKAF